MYSNQKQDIAQVHIILKVLQTQRAFVIYINLYKKYNGFRIQQRRGVRAINAPCCRRELSDAKNIRVKISQPDDCVGGLQRCYPQRAGKTTAGLILVAISMRSVGAPSVMSSCFTDSARLLAERRFISLGPRLSANPLPPSA